MENNFTPGCKIYLVERDECGYPVDVSGYMFVTDVLEYAILTAYINDLKTIEETLEYHEQECWENYDTDLVVAKLSDCYSCFEFAEEAMREEVGDSDG
jgi:hypothetical protein